MARHRKTHTAQQSVAPQTQRQHIVGAHLLSFVWLRFVAVWLSFVYSPAAFIVILLLALSFLRGPLDKPNRPNNERSPLPLSLFGCLFVLRSRHSSSFALAPLYPRLITQPILMAASSLFVFAFRPLRYAEWRGKDRE